MNAILYGVRNTFWLVETGADIHDNLGDGSAGFQDCL
jgi:hypothetical protein